jgi:hypothetical protein
MTVEPDIQVRHVLRRLALSLGGLGLVTALALLALQRSDVGQAAISELLTNARPGPLAMSLSVMSLGMLFVALRWRALIPGDQRMAPTGMTAIVCAALLVNYAMPGPVGELAGAGLVRRRYGVPATVALAASLYGRLIGLGLAGAGMGLIWASGTLPVPPEYEDIIGLAAGGISIGALVGAALGVRPAWLSRGWAATLGRLGAWGSRLDVGVQRLVVSLGEISDQPPRAWAAAMGWAICGHLSVSTGIWLGAGALGVDALWGGVVFTYLASAAAVVVMFALPGAQVGWDAMFFSFLSVTAGVEATDALAITALQRLQQVLLLLIGSGSLVVLLAPRRPRG